MPDSGSDTTAEYEQNVLAELLKQFAEGEDDAFCRFVDVVGDRLFGFVCRMVANHHSAEDVYQMVLFRIAMHAGSYDGRARVMTWAFTIARNGCIDAIRKEGRHKTVVMPEEMIQQIPAEGELMSDEELGLRIDQALQTLPTEQKEVFLLREDAGLGFDEIGELLGCGRETAKSRMRYALRKLQQTLLPQAKEYGVVSEANT